MERRVVGEALQEDRDRSLDTLQVGNGTVLSANHCFEIMYIGDEG